MLPLINEFYVLVKFYPALISFFSGFVSEEFIIFMSILSGRGEFGVLPIFAGAFAGLFLMDQICFAVGKMEFLRRIKNHKEVKKIKKKLPDFVQRIGERNIFLEIFLTKFIFGIRTATVISISNKEIPYKKFFWQDFAAILAWLAVAIPVGWLAGKGLTLFFVFFKEAEKFLFVSVILVLIYFLVIREVIVKQK